MGGSLNNLRFSEKLWESDFFSSSGFYTNRIQFEDMVSLIQQAGFEVDVNHVKRWETLPTAPENGRAILSSGRTSSMFQGFSITCV